VDSGRLEAALAAGGKAPFFLPGLRVDGINVAVAVETTTAPSATAGVELIAPFVLKVQIRDPSATRME
jgi:hypothetical protein